MLSAGIVSLFNGRTSDVGTGFIQRRGRNLRMAQRATVGAVYNISYIGSGIRNRCFGWVPFVRYYVLCRRMFGVRSDSISALCSWATHLVIGNRYPKLALEPTKFGSG